MTTYAMNASDSAWYHNDGPANFAIVTGVLLTKRPLAFAKVRAVYRERLLAFPRFQQRVVELGFPFPTPHWQDMPNFDIDQHIHHIALAAPHNERALQTLISDIASTPLDHGIPLWQLYVIDEVNGGSALAMRCHHCMADGTAMMTLAQALFDANPSSVHRKTRTAIVAPVVTIQAGSADASPRGGVLDTVFGTIDQAKRLVDGAGMLLSELLKPDDPQSPLKGEFGPRKQVAWSSPIAIKDIKAVGACHGAKVNDVLVAAMTGALRTYLKGRGVKVNHSTVRAMVPVDQRPPAHYDRLGNEFGLVLLELAVNKARPEQRLALTKARMDALKRSSEPVASYVLLDILGRGPKALEDFSNDLFGRKASLVMTNVRGPQGLLQLAGVPIERMYAWAPHPGKQLGMAVSIMSYRGTACLTVIADARLVPDPQVIADEFNREFQQMLQSIKMTD